MSLRGSKPSELASFRNTASAPEVKLREEEAKSSPNDQAGLQRPQTQKEYESKPFAQAEATDSHKIVPLRWYVLQLLLWNFGGGDGKAGDEGSDEAFKP